MSEWTPACVRASAQLAPNELCDKLNRLEASLAEAKADSKRLEELLDPRINHQLYIWLLDNPVGGLTRELIDNWMEEQS